MHTISSSPIAHGRRQRREIGVLALPSLPASDPQEKSFFSLESPVHSPSSLQHSLFIAPVMFVTLHGSHVSSGSSSSSHSLYRREQLPTTQTGNESMELDQAPNSKSLHVTQMSTRRRPPPLNLGGQYHSEEHFISSPPLLSSSTTVSTPLSAPIHLFGSTISPVSVEFSVPSTQLCHTTLASPISPFTPSPRILDPAFGALQDKQRAAATLRRRKMAKLIRTLGEQVPVELVFGRQQEPPGNLPGKPPKVFSEKLSRGRMEWDHPVANLQVNIHVSVTEAISSPPPSAVFPPGIRLGMSSPFRLPWSRTASGNCSPAPFTNLTFITGR